MSGGFDEKTPGTRHKAQGTSRASIPSYTEHMYVGSILCTASLLDELPTSSDMSFSLHNMHATRTDVEPSTKQSPLGECLTVYKFSRTDKYQPTYINIMQAVCQEAS